jgi:ligand-binding SRPBCC domain-containing protein
MNSGHCTLEDSIEYDMKFKHLLNPIADLVVEPDLTRLFKFRHAVTIAQFENRI